MFALAVCLILRRLLPRAGYLTGGCAVPVVVLVHIPIAALVLVVEMMDGSIMVAVVASSNRSTAVVVVIINLTTKCIAANCKSHCVRRAAQNLESINMQTSLPRLSNWPNGTCSSPSTICFPEPTTSTRQHENGGGSLQMQMRDDHLRLGLHTTHVIFVLM